MLIVLCDQTSLFKNLKVKRLKTFSISFNEAKLARHY